MLEPFAGSGSTLVVAKKLGRKFVGFELSENYAAKVRARLDGVTVGEALEGAEEPKVSAPATPGLRNGKKHINGNGSGGANGQERLLCPGWAQYVERPAFLRLSFFSLVMWRLPCASISMGMVPAGDEVGNEVRPGTS